MSTQTISLPTEFPDRRFAVLAVGFVLIASLVTGFLPIGVSIIAVFLCAGPHNWVEARYSLSRLPARWGKLTGFFTLGLGGVAVLTGVFAAIHWLVGDGGHGIVGPISDTNLPPWGPP